MLAPTMSTTYRNNAVSLPGLAACTSPCMCWPHAHQLHDWWQCLLKLCPVRTLPHPRPDNIVCGAVCGGHLGLVSIFLRL